MKALFLLSVVFAVANALAPLFAGEPSSVIPGQYIIVLNENATVGRTLSLAASLESSVFGTYTMDTFRGFAAKLTQAQLNMLRKSPDVKYIEADQQVHTTQACEQQNNAGWGLDRVSEQDLNLDGIYRYHSPGGTGIDGYIIDTGIFTTHVDFGGRATWGANFVDTNNADCNGHGTHVAGTIGGTVYGVAKKTTLIAVKVLDCNGSGSWTGVISGIDWVADQFQSTGIPSTINMSLGGGLNTAVNNAVEACVAAGVIVVVAAGNNDMNACSFSPASAPSAISVAATGTDSASGQKDTRAYFSNYGPCVDVLAPGLLITSAWITSNTAVNTISGTSMASPHVCGVVAMYLATHQDRDPDTVKAWIASSATSGIVELECGASETVCQGTVNLLLHNQCA
jgi:subtilisin family serine protease